MRVRLKPPVAELLQRSGHSLRPRARRGIAMLLVLMVLAGVSVMTAAAISSQQSAPDIGLNAARDIQAQWSAESAANLAVAVLETTYDFTGANADVIVGQAVGAGIANVSVTNLSGNPPTADDRELILTATSTVGGVTRQIRKVISITPAVPFQDAIDPHLGEFGVAATNALGIDDGATVSVWRRSPDASVNRPVAIGALMPQGSKISIGAAANLKNAALFGSAAGDAGVGSASAHNALAARGAKLPYTIPAAPELRPAAMESLPVACSSDLTVSGLGVDQSLPTSGKFESVKIESNAKLRLNAANGSMYSFNALKMQNGGQLIISGSVLIEVRAALSLESRSAIVLEPGAAVAFFTRDDVEISDSTVGAPAAVAALSGRKVACLDSYSRPDRIRFFPQSTSTGGKHGASFSIRDNALLLACIHAPTSQFELRDTSVLVGRASARQVNLESGSSLFYDPALDTRSGFTNTKGPLYASDGSPDAGLEGVLNGFNPDGGAKALKSQLDLLTLTVGTVVVGVGELLGGGAPDAGTPTPRNNRRVDARPLDEVTDAVHTEEG